MGSRVNNKNTFPYFYQRPVQTKFPFSIPYLKMLVLTYRITTKESASVI